LSSEIQIGNKKVTVTSVIAKSSVAIKRKSTIINTNSNSE